VHSLVADSSGEYVATYAGPARDPVAEPEPIADQPPAPWAGRALLGRHPARRGAGPVARFEFAAAGATRFRCKLDAGPYRSCRSPKVYRGLRQGKHTLRVVAVGPEGAGSRPTVFRWRVGPAAR